MSQLTAPLKPRRATPIRVQPAAVAQSLGDTIKRQSLGSGHVDLKLDFDVQSDAHGRILGAALGALQIDTAEAQVPTNGLKRPQHLAGTGFVWVDFRGLYLSSAVGNFRQTNSPRTVKAISGSTVTLNSNINLLDIVGEWVTIGSELAVVVRKSATKIVVWPAPRFPTSADKRDADLFNPLAGLHGCWCMLPGELPPIVREPAKPPYCEAYSVTLRVVR